MYRVSLIGGSLAKRHYGDAAEGEVMVATSQDSPIVELRRYASFEAFLATDEAKAMLPTLSHAFYGVMTTDLLPGECPTTYQQLCDRLGVISQDQQDETTAEMNEYNAANPVQPQIGERQPDFSPGTQAFIDRHLPGILDTRPESGRQIDAAVCADCGNAECTCTTPTPPPGMSCREAMTGERE